MASGYPYDGLSEALGRDLTEDEVAEAWKIGAPGAPGGDAAQSILPTGGTHPAGPGPQVNVPGQPGRWKDNGAGQLVWDPTDIGPDQQLQTPGVAPAAAPAMTPEVAATLPASAVPAGTTPAAVASPAPAVASPAPASPVPAATPAPWGGLSLPESLGPSTTAGNFQAPPYVAPPAYTAPTLTPPARYTPLTQEELLADPGYDWRLSQGVRAADMGAAAKGTVRTGGHMADLTAFGQGLASQEWAAADKRKGEAWERNWGADKDVWDRAFEGSGAEYAPGLLGWQTQTNAGQRAAELNFDRDWQEYVYKNDDDFRKVVYGTDDAFRKAVEAESDLWKRELMFEERRRWLAELGAQA